MRPGKEKIIPLHATLSKKVPWYLGIRDNPTSADPVETLFALVYFEILEKSHSKQTEQEFVGVHKLNSLEIPFAQSTVCPFMLSFT